MSDNPFVWPVRVYYEDTDAGGVVYHSVYLNYMERCRTEWLRSFGVGQEALVRDAGILFAVAKIDISFLGPARLDDQLTVYAQVQKIGQASVALMQGVIRDHDRKELVRAQVKIGCIDREFKPTRMPEALQHLMAGGASPPQHPPADE